VTDVTGVAIRFPYNKKYSGPQGDADCHTSVRTTSKECHAFLARQNARNDRPGRLVYSDHPSDKSFYCGFLLSISLFFRFLFQLLICFSLVIAIYGSGVSS
jgi:hypothetical protein